MGRATPRIICHRGACLDAPENTLAAARRALELGGGWIELDIRQSRDGVAYVLHDATIDRTTDGAIADEDSDEIDALDAPGQAVPRPRHRAGDPMGIRRPRRLGARRSRRADR